MKKVVLVTGGAGFIGSALVRRLIRSGRAIVVNVDKLTYAGNLDALEETRTHPDHHFHQLDICDREAMSALFAKTKPEWVFHLAAESHVDNSIKDPSPFVQTNVVGTFSMLEAARAHFGALDEASKQKFRFLHISTDEVFGSLGEDGYFSETTPYAPNSPYSASKAGSDHLVRAWHHTFGLPTLMTNCSNNYGPWQYPEKLIPVTVLNALAGKNIPVYGKGQNVRDWLFVDDHVDALLRVVERGRVGGTYNVGTRNERTNLWLVNAICGILNELAPQPRIGDYTKLISFVTDRAGHDLRYAIEPHKLERELDWKAGESFDSGLRKTVEWYVEHQDWCRHIAEKKK